MTVIDAPPRLTVLFPTKNRKEQFRAVLARLLEDKRMYPDLEIVVIDGGSTDGTLDVIREHASDIVVCTSAEGGLYAALNVGLRHATGEWVRMVSDDDGYVTGCLQYFAEFMRRHPSYAAIGGTATYVRIGEDGSETASPIGSRVGEISIGTYLHVSSLVQCVHEALFFRRDLLDSLGGWNEQYMVSGDLDLVFRLLRRGRKICIIPQTVVHARRSADSLSRRHGRRSWIEPLLSLFWTGHWRVLASQLLRIVSRRLGGS